LACREKDFKRVIAYSSIAHMNLSLIGLFSLTIEGIIGGFFLMVSHGLIAAALFFLVGIVYSRFHTKFIGYFGGLCSIMPVFVFFFFFFTLANIGFPGTSSFPGEILIFIGIVGKSQFCFYLSVLSILFSGVYFV
jgi:NADH-quinone oxidoreductase subunit M